ncbi:MAG: 4-hydroxy-3-methylbut-2-enyl diphosphate reductase [Magnetococcales bacterium]|nr:4-hydroxy-3-methylbut-2-enyl diphosphate reductase [Magnetococcales bacterium]HIJ83167.1 4-hydroxy-3-methylbut-2-enyl diphosphate reductase [Magnetococcales bacterium]
MHVVLAQPRGFCAGVERAIAIVEKALDVYGAPLYVRHEIVHNRWVVDSLRKKGAVFVDELDVVPDGATVIFSAHGVSKAVELEGQRRPLRVLDATCPLVEKVHRQAIRLHQDGYRVILIGHPGHPEVEGTVGQLPPGNMEVIRDELSVTTLPDRPIQKVAYITQTTLSLDETAHVVHRLRDRFPNIRSPGREDICYATQNRQNAVKSLAKRCDLILVLGAPNSSNSNRLREVAEREGTSAFLIESADDVRMEWLQGVQTLGITAGASAPELLVEGLLEHLGVDPENVEVLSVSEENLVFPLPRELLNPADLIHSPDPHPP